MSEAPRRFSPGWKRPLVRWLTQVTALFLLWVVLSQRWEVEFLAAGALTAVGAAAFTNWFFHGTHEGHYRPAPGSFRWLARTLVRLAIFLAWLAYEIVASSLHVASLVLHRRMPIYPSLVQFETTLESEYARVLLTQSITVAPGSVTIDATEGVLLVHCLSEKPRHALATGSLQRKVAWVFGEPSADQVTLRDIVHPSQVPL